MKETPEETKERRYKTACAILNVTEEKHLDRKPRNPSRGFKILKGLEEMNWHLTPDEIVAFAQHYERRNKGYIARGQVALSPPATIQAWHNVLVQWRYSEDYTQFNAPEMETIEPIDNPRPFSKEKMQMVMGLLSQGFRETNPVKRAQIQEQLQGVLNDTANPEI